MSERAHLFQAAAGSGWTAPEDALADDSDYALFPKSTVTPTNLRLTDATNRIYHDLDEINGILASIEVGASGQILDAAGQLSAGGTIFTAFDDASNVLDGVIGTYYGFVSAADGLRTVGVIIDLGEPLEVSHIKSNVHLHDGEESLGPPSFYKSSDGINWTALSVVPGAAWPVLGPGPQDVDWNKTLVDAPHDARYFKAEFDDGQTGVDGLPRINDFRLYQADTTTEVVRVIDVYEYLETAITLDGTTAASDWQTIEVGASGGTFEIGGIADLWGLVDLFGEEVNESTFGLLTRRKSAMDAHYQPTDRLIDVESMTTYFDAFVYSSMATRSAERQLCLIGLEATPGAAESPSIRLKATRLRFNPSTDEEEIRYQGDLLPGDYVTIAEKAEGSLEGAPTYDEFGLVLASVLGKPSTQLLATGVYRHEFIIDTRGPGDPQTFTHEFGDTALAERTLYALLTGCGIGWSRREKIGLSGRAIGQKMTDDQAGVTAGVDAVQTITITGTPTGGTFKLRFRGQDTTAIAYNANAAAVTAALEALSSIGVGNVVVSGTTPNFTATFAVDLGGVHLPILELAVNAFTGGTSPDITFAITTLGGYTEYNCIPILPGHNTNYYASTRATLAANKLSKARRARWEISDRFEDVWWLDAAEGSFAEHGDAAMQMMATFSMNADTAAATIADDVNAATPKYLRQEFVGPLITGSYYNTLTIDMAVKVKSKKPYSQDGVVYGREFDFGCIFDKTWGRSAQISLINAVASYT